MLAICAALAVLCLGTASAQAAGFWFPRFEFASGEGSTGYPSMPFVAVRGDGAVYLAYRTNAGFSPPGRVAVRVRDPQGNLSPDLNLVQPAGSTNQVPRGIHLGPNGVGTVLWADNAALSALRLRRFDGAGTLDPTTIDITTPGQSTSLGVLAGDAAGNSTAAWRNDATHRVELRRVSAGGQVGPIVPVSPAGANPDPFVQLALAPDGTAVLVWHDQDSLALYLRTVAPDGTLGALETLSASPDSFSPSLDLDGAGNALVTWSESPDNVIRMRSRSAAGALGPIQTVSTEGAAQNAQIGVADDGAAAIVWRETVVPTSDRILARRRSADGNLGPVVTIASAESGSGVQRPAVDVESGGIATVLWEDLAADRMEGRGFREDGSLDPVTPVSDPNPYDYGIGGDGFGNTAVAAADISTKKVDAQLFDGGGPEVRALSVPGQLERGVAGSFSFTPFDLLSTVASTGWEFGDGATANGATASHGFALAGSFTVAAVATDSVGNVRRVRRTVRVVDTRRPQLARLKIAPAKFRLGKRATARTAAKRKAKRRRAPAGTKISFRLSEDASVRLTVQRRTTGRKVGRTCRRQTRRNRSAKRCVRFVAVKGFVLTRASKQGVNTVRFSGRVGRRKLAAGKYRLVARATDPSRNASKQALRGFRVVR